MLDIKWIKSNPDLLKKGLISRGELDWSSEKVTTALSEAKLEAKKTKESLKFLNEHSNIVDIDKIKKLEELDSEKRQYLFEVENLKSNRNKVSQQVAARKAAKQPADDLLSGMKQVSDDIKALDEKVSCVDLKLEELLLTVPNVPHCSVPIGAGDEDNPEARRFGTPKSFSFNPLDHVDLGVNLKILDLERAVKISGARFSVLKGSGAALERAITSFMLDHHTQVNGYKEIYPPVIVNANSLRGTGQLPKFEADLFKLRDQEYYLIPTAEVPVTNLHSNEILPETALTIKYCAFTQCFRSEAGSYGKDTRGLIRQHQFDKVELVKFAHPDKSYEELEKLTSDAESILQTLGLPYRLVTLSTGDMGFSAAKTYDIEVWLPSQKTYREISSCSNFEDFQARRANIRFKGEGKTAKTAFVHTLNGSGLAVGRTWVAIMENYQDENGKIFIPEPLRKYMAGKTHIEKEDFI
ncbi:MAG: serine--tRNA ligase [Candidatus Riflebacteria bacterium]|nr:serine--tRNA ligase [Candidatus Riflebacteria bacterium]